MAVQSHTLSKPGAQFIADQEGYREMPYRDPVGIETVGYGHVITPADGNRYRAGLSREAALELLERDASGAAAEIARNAKVPLTQPQFDALVSFAFNLGWGTLAASSLWREINAGPLLHEVNEHSTAAQNTLRGLFVEYDHAGGKVLPGLTKRRTLEAHMFMTGHYADA